MSRLLIRKPLNIMICSDGLHDSRPVLICLRSQTRLIKPRSFAFDDLDVLNPMRHGFVAVVSAVACFRHSHLASL